MVVPSPSSPTLKDDNRLTAGAFMPMPMPIMGSPVVAQPLATAIPAVPMGGMMPMGGGIMPMGGMMPGLPPCPFAGLEYLNTLDFVHIRQKVDVNDKELQTNNTYAVFSGHGPMVFHAKEHTNYFERQMREHRRDFSIAMVTPYGQIALRIQRESPGCSGTTEVHVMGPTHVKYGIVAAQRGCCGEDMQVCNELYQLLYTVRPENGFWRGRKVNYLLTDNSGNVAAKIEKLYGGFAKEWFTNADNYTVHFPSNLDVRVKATLVAATILIDYEFYEQN